MTASTYPFSKKERLRQASEFRGLLKNAQVVCESGVSLYFSKNPETRKSRLGIVISRSVVRHAADRNRIKRIVREFFRLHKPEFHGNFDLIVRIIDSSKLFNQNNLSKSLTHLFHHAGVLHK